MPTECVLFSHDQQPNNTNIIIIYVLTFVCI